MVNFACDNLKTKLNLYKNGGKFYNSKGIDAYILSNIFGYKVINEKCGFPDNIIERIIAKLESEKISYEIIYHDKDSKSKKFKYNNYFKFRNEALQRMAINEKLQLIENKLKNAVPEDLERLLDIINESL